MKIVMIYDQIQSGAGIKDDHQVALGALKEAVGPAIMMEPFLRKVDGRVVACLYCGDGFFASNEEMVTSKMVAMVQKIKPDVVICGPCFNYEGYGLMAATISDAIQTNTSIPTFSAMSIENSKTIEKFKDKIHIVKTPKKGGTGLNDALEGMCLLAKALVEQENIQEISEKYCF